MKIDLVSEIAKMDADHFTALLDASDKEHDALFDKFEKVSDDIIPLFKNVELHKYYSKVMRELLGRISN